MLNNKGYGIKDVMMVVCVMMVAVFVTMFIYNKNFKSLFEGDVDKDSVPETKYNYELLEEELETAAKQYYSENFKEDVASEIPLMTVTFNTLKDKNYLSSLEANGESCNGYVNIKNNGGKISYDAFVKCDNYVTEGYSASLNN